jgi:hypothetical protein
MCACLLSEQKFQPLGFTGDPCQYNPLVKTLASQR